MLFVHTTRYTFTGRTAHNSKKNDQPKNASGLNIIQILLDVGQKKYQVDKKVASAALNKALNNFNEAIVAKRRRQQLKSVTSTSQTAI